MPDKLLQYYIEKPLVIISINSENWGWVTIVWIEIDTGVI
jgi:hypothetical protein